MTASTGTAVVVLLASCLLQVTFILARNFRFHPLQQSKNDRMVFAFYGSVASLALSSLFLALCGDPLQKETLYILFTRPISDQQMGLIVLQPLTLLVNSVVNLKINISFTSTREVLYVCIFAPVFEELAYRGFVEAFLRTRGVHLLLRLLLSNVLFSMMHILTYKDNIRAARDIVELGSILKEALTNICLQTFAFGAWSHFVLLSTNSLLGCIIVHMMCNIIGPPDMYTTTDVWYNLVGTVMFVFDITFMYLHNGRTVLF